MVREPTVKLLASLLVLTALGSATTPVAAQVKVETLPDKPPNQHWLWLTNMEFGHYSKSVLYNAENGYILGSVDIGWEGIKQEFPHSGNEIYSAAAYMSRGFRGTRTDVVQVIDKHTLLPLREIVIPGKTIKGWPDPTLTALGDDDAFMFVQFMAPGSSVGVADLKSNAFAGEIETAGCAHVMAAGKRRFMSLCGDGSLLAVDIDDAGHEVSRKHYPGFFDADKDPLHGSGARSGDIWYFVSHRGQIHSVDVSGSELKFLPTWQVATRQPAKPGAKGDEKTWIPGTWMQSVAVNGRLGRLYLSMQLSDLKPKLSGYDFHAKSGTEIWAFDLASKRPVQKIKTKDPVNHIAVSQDESPLLYAGDIWGLKVGVYDEKSGKHLRDISVFEMPSVLQPVD
jgi:methylamine dehydrogenase heavy chain